MQTNQLKAQRTVGSLIKLADGTEYKIGKHGNWVRVSGRNSGKRKARGAGQRRHRARVGGR